MSDRYPSFPPETMSVTEVLTAVGLIDSRFYTPASAERGTQVHLACQYLAENRLDWESLDPRIEPWVRSCEKLLQATRWVANATETVKYDPVLKLCGRFDYEAEQNTLLDFKSGGAAPFHEIQLGMYWHLNGKKGQIATCYLQDDGSMARLKFHNPLDAWRKAITVINFFNLKASL